MGSNKGFGSLGICSGINSLLPCSVCMYNCSVDSRKVCLSILFSNVIVSSMFHINVCYLICVGHMLIFDSYFLYILCALGVSLSGFCLSVRHMLFTVFTG